MLFRNFQVFLSKVTRFQKLQRFRIASVWDFSPCLQSYEVTKVSMLLRNFYFKKLQGFRSYEGFTGLLLGIFSYVSKVTRLRKIRCFLEIFKKNPKVLKLLTFESHDAFGIFNNLFKSYKVSEVTKFKILQFLYNFSAKKFIITKLQSYEVTTETSVKSIHVSCHI